jgi:hypothetical protein
MLALMFPGASTRAHLAQPFARSRAVCPLAVSLLAVSPLAVSVLAVSVLAACGGPDASPDGGAREDGARPDAGGGCSGALAAWGEPVRVRPGLDLAGGEIFAPAVAVNDQGVAVVAWAERAGAADRVLAARFEDGCWEAPVELAPADGLGADVALDADGSATVVWTRRERDGAVTTVWAARHEDGAWQAPQRISADPALDATSYALEPQMTLDGAGGVVVAWIQRATKGDSVAWSRFPDIGPATGWSAPGTISSGVILGAEVQVVDAGAGQLVAIWRQRAEPPPFEAVTNVFASRWTGTAWSVAERIGDPSLTGSDHAEGLRLVSRGGDGASALWLQSQAAERTHRQNDLDAASQTWAGAVPLAPLVDALPDTVSSIDVAGSATGAMALVWLATRGDINDVWVARFEAGAGWGEAGLLEDGAAGAATPAVGMDGRGHVLSAWAQPGAETELPRLWVRRAGAAGAWSAAEEIETSILGRPSIAVSHAGYALVALASDAGVGAARHGFITAIVSPPAP